MLGAWCREDRLGRRLVVILQGLPCAWGKCRFCPFAMEQGVRLGEVIERNRGIIREAERLIDGCGAQRVSIFNGSSFYELPYETVSRLRRLTEGRVVDIESRPEYLTLETLEATLEALGAELLVVRVGVEVWDDRLRNDYLGKGISREEIERLSRLRLEARDRGLPVQLVAYVLFGIEGIPEEKVVESVRELNRRFDGVIAVRYHRYADWMPAEAPVSSRLKELLEREALLVDWGEEPDWIIAGRSPGSSKPSRGP